MHYDIIVHKSRHETIPSIFKLTHFLASLHFPRKKCASFLKAHCHQFKMAFEIWDSINWFYFLFLHRTVELVSNKSKWSKSLSVFFALKNVFFCWNSVSARFFRIRLDNWEIKKKKRKGKKSILLLESSVKRFIMNNLAGKQHLTPECWYNYYWRYQLSLLALRVICLQNYIDFRLLLSL